MSLDFIRKYDEDITKEELDHFDSWVKDNSYFDDYKIYELLREEVLIRIYKFVPEDSVENPLFDENFEPLGADREKVLPFAKVIAVGPTAKLPLKPGDIISVLEAVGLKQYNPDFLDWQERRVAQPGFDRPMPNVFIHGLEKLQSMMFVKDKVMGLQDEDILTYLIPESLVRTKVNFDV